MSTRRWRAAALIPVLAFGLMAAAQAQVRLTSETKDGQVISRSHTFTIRAQSESLVTSVEFYVNDSLRSTDDSTPYELTIDTLQEADGPLTVRADAYNEKGQKGTVTLKVTVDNQVAKGLDFHLEAGREAISVSKWDDAIYHGRVALKIKEDSSAARLVLSRANFGKGVNDLAQKYLEDVLAAEPKNPEALNLLAGLQIERAFATIGGAQTSRMEAINQIGAALKRAAEARASYLDSLVDQLPETSSGFDPARYRVMADARRYGRIIQELEARAAAEPKDTALQNWTIFALLRAGRFNQAATLMSRYERLGTPDDYGYTLAAVIKDRQGDDTGSRKAEELALLNESNTLAVRSGQAFLALRRGSTKTFGSVTQELAKADDAGYIALTYLSTLYLMAGQFTESTDTLKRALLAEPSNVDGYVERGNQLVLTTLNDTATSEDEKKAQRAMARAFYNAALGARPESAEALTALGLLAGIEGSLDDSIRLLEAASKASPDYSPSHYGLSGAYSVVRTRLTNRIAVETDAQKKAALTRELTQWEGRARQSLATAQKVDQGNLEGRTVPTFLVAWRYFYTRGRAPLLPSP